MMFAFLDLLSYIVYCVAVVVFYSVFEIKHFFPFGTTNFNVFYESNV